jgi:hypothetical protein
MEVPESGKGSIFKVRDADKVDGSIEMSVRDGATTRDLVVKPRDAQEGEELMNSLYVFVEADSTWAAKAGEGGKFLYWN